MENRVICLGVRGSLPVCRADSIRYGGSTTCFAVRLAGELILLDAGTGLASLPEYLLPSDKTAALIMTHAHADHLIGLPSLLAASKKGVNFTVYGRTRLGRTVREQINAYMTPPLWPVGMDIVAPGTRYAELPDEMMIGDVKVETVEGIHPDGVSVIRLTGDGKSIVLMTDCTVCDENRERLAAFCRGCDLLLIDGQYSDEEWDGRESFGHNTYRAAAAFGRSCCAKQVRIIHHAPHRTDAEMDEAAKEIGCRFAGEGEVIAL